jgi:hypothetical protein
MRPFELIRLETHALDGSAMSTSHPGLLKPRAKTRVIVSEATYAPPHTTETVPLCKSYRHYGR